jgi:glycosyltransferase involved in cell wall biosynthesis
MTSRPQLVSIIMPVYNGEQYLKQAINSVLAQTYSQWELIVVDDGSNDGTANIVKTYPDPRIRYFYQPNKGQAAALNRGLELAQGEYITTLDADDWYPAHSLYARANFLNQHPEIGAAYGDGVYCNQAGESLLLFSQQMPNGISGDVFDMLIVSPFYGTGATVLVRRDVLVEHEIGYDESIIWCQDWDFYIRLAKIAQYGYVEQVTVHYRLHHEGMTLTVPQGRRLDSVVRTRKKVMESPRFNQVSDAQKSAFFYDFIIVDLADNIVGQTEIFESDQFLALPNRQQSRLLRIAAIKYLRQNIHLNPARKWLQRAWAISPFDSKTAVVAGSCIIHPGLARQIIKLWQGDDATGDHASGFYAAVVAGQSSE